MPISLHLPAFFVSCCSNDGRSSSVSLCTSLSSSVSGEDYKLYTVDLFTTSTAYTHIYMYQVKRNVYRHMVYCRKYISFTPNFVGIKAHYHPKPFMLSKKVMKGALRFPLSIAWYKLASTLKCHQRKCIRKQVCTCAQLYIHYLIIYYAGFIQNFCWRGEICAWIIFFPLISIDM